MLRGGGPGTVFAVNKDGSEFHTLYVFSGGADGTDPNGLVLLENTLYGSARGYYGKDDGQEYPQNVLKSTGSVFKLQTDGSSFEILHTFAPPSGPFSPQHTNADGYLPSAIIVSGNAVYGTTSSGGSGACGTIFKVNIHDKAYTVLHSFSQTEAPEGPSSGVTLYGDTLYGTTAVFEMTTGSLFKIKTDGTEFQTFYNFLTGFVTQDGLYNSGGGEPSDTVISANTLYGTALIGGSAASGTVFSLSFSPQLTTTPSAAGVVLSWPTNYAGFDYTGYALESTTNLGSSPWTSNIPAPVVLNGRKSVTVPVTGRQQFFRLKQ
jgi:uncharacterized repeat protein (TIGR03803 family)